MNHAMTSAVARLPMIQLADVSVTYQGEERPTVQHCSLLIEKGETVLVVGSSGSGKSTLAMAIAGIIPRSIEGTVEGRLTLSEELREPGKIGYVFQNPETQFCMLHAGDEVAFGLENLQVARGDMPDRIKQAFDKVGLAVPFDARHATFSGGMKQKLAIASALAMDSELLIFDEPTANLDPLSTRVVFEQIVALREQGHTLVVIEHKFEPLLPFVDKVVEFSATGELVEVHTRDAFIRKRQRNPQVARQRGHARSLAATNDNPCLVVNDAGLAYGDKVVWQDVSFSVFPGEWIAVLGPNGAGKSSLIEVMAGLTKPTAGTVELFGTPIRKMKTKEKFQHIAFGFQNPEYQFLYERVRDEVAGQVVDGDLPEDADDILRLFGLKDLADASPYALSQGQKRRLAVAVMLQSNHDLYLFDEPTYGQDEASEATILAQLTALQQSGKTVVTVTHDLNLVAKYATRVLVVANGRLLFDGDFESLKRRADVMQEAHLEDDVLPIESLEHGREEAQPSIARQDIGESGQKKRFVTPFMRLHPTVKLVTLLFVSVLTLFAQDFTHVERMWLIPLFMMFGLAWLNPWRVFKRLWVILLLYVIYVWTFAANAAVPSGTPSVHFLWFQISTYGMWEGILVAIRTFSTVVLAYVFLDTTDGTDFVVSLSQTFHVTPKFSYGAMAGTSFFPRFQDELRIFRSARQVRGRDGWWISRPVTYALPMLSQSIRLGERVAMAMEARGFYGPPANRATSRTYFRRTPLRVRDVVFFVLTVMVSMILFFS